MGKVNVFWRRLQLRLKLTAHSYFNLTETVTKTINSILGYMPTVNHWGWNGNARRYWDNM